MKSDYSVMYLVVGCAGAYDGYREWPCAVLSSKTGADSLCDRNNSVLKKWKVYGAIHSIKYEDALLFAEKGVGEVDDPLLEVDYNYGLSYEVREVRVVV